MIYSQLSTYYKHVNVAYACITVFSIAYVKCARHIGMTLHPYMSCSFYSKYFLYANKVLFTLVNKSLLVYKKNIYISLA
jgi:hypothetical protein